MATQAHLDANARYLSTQKTITLRMKPEHYDQIKAAADREGQSVNAYINDAISEKMQKK